MIDNPMQVERVIALLRASLPLLVTVTPELAALVRKQSLKIDPLRRYSVSRVDYAGDEGGIMCKLELGPEQDGQPLYTTITHLRFAPAGPIARQVLAYQRHRSKRLRRLHRGLVA